MGMADVASPRAAEAAAATAKEPVAVRTVKRKQSGSTPYASRPSRARAKALPTEGAASSRRVLPASWTPVMGFSGFGRLPLRPNRRQGGVDAGADDAQPADG